jgi:hypothetical protein
MAGKQSWSPDTRKTDEEFLAPDKKLTATRAQGFDSNSICVRTPQAVRSDSLGPGCFGDGFFTEPVWAPF